MSILARLLHLLWPPDCRECGAYKYGRLGGTYWHNAGCSATVAPPPPSGRD